jgi:hypothetical protein
MRVRGQVSWEDEADVRHSAISTKPEVDLPVKDELPSKVKIPYNLKSTQNPSREACLKDKKLKRWHEHRCQIRGYDNLVYGSLSNSTPCYELQCTIVNTHEHRNSRRPFRKQWMRHGQLSMFVHALAEPGERISSQRESRRETTCPSPFVHKLLWTPSHPRDVDNCTSDLTNCSLRRFISATVQEPLGHVRRLCAALHAKCVPQARLSP